MKIERTNKAFQPIELKITIETEEEFDMIECITILNHSIPKMVFKEFPEIKEDDTKTFLRKLSDALDVD